MRRRFRNISSFQAQRVLALLFILALAFAVRSLTANFLRAHLDDASWFQFGSYAVFDQPAQDILDHKSPLFWISDPSRTDRIVYPPGYSLWLALIYRLTGERSAAAVQRVQWLLDSLSVLLIVAIASIAYRWKVGLIAGVLAALSPLLALGGATPNADAPASWLILGAVLFLILAARRQRVGYAIAAGGLLGLACWLRVNPLFLFVVWAIALFVFIQANRGRRILLSATLALSTLLVISPIVVRNLVVFYPEVAPTGLGIGWNLWAGIGETDRGQEFGAPCCDQQMIERDRKGMGLPADAQIGLFWPDGIRRDHERGQKALAVIKAHPIWYSGVMARRVWGNLKFAGKPAPNVGSAGFNVTSQKCLSPKYRSGVLAVAVNTLGMVQSVFRYVALPLMLLGIWLALKRDFRITLLLLSTVIYYLATLAVGHSEIRYGLPMQAVLIVFAAITISDVGSIWSKLWREFESRAGF